jgi:hypothetical protein
VSYPVFDRSASPPYQQVFDYTGSPDGVQPVYVGWAPPGAAITANSWMIRKFFYASNGQGGYNITNIQFANGDTGFSQVWNTTAGSVIGSTYGGGAIFK